MPLVLTGALFIRPPVWPSCVALYSASSRLHKERAPIKQPILLHTRRIYIMDDDSDVPASKTLASYVEQG